MRKLPSRFPMITINMIDKDDIQIYLGDFIHSFQFLFFHDPNTYIGRSCDSWLKYEFLERRRNWNCQVIQDQGSFLFFFLSLSLCSGKCSFGRSIFNSKKLLERRKCLKISNLEVSPAPRVLVKEVRKQVTPVYQFGELSDNLFLQ